MTDPEYNDEDERIDCEVCECSTLQDEYMICPDCEHHMCIYCYEEHDCPGP